MQITNAEWKIMELLWNESPRTMTEMTKMLKDDTGWTKQTIITMLQRMTEKNNTLRRRKAKFSICNNEGRAEKRRNENALLESFNWFPFAAHSAMVKNQR